jgi:hypothetical protein
MKKITASIIAVAAATNAHAFAVTAYSTGQQELVQTVTGQTVVRCHFQYSGQEFTKLYPFGTICPMSIEVE